MQLPNQPIQLLRNASSHLRHTKALMRATGEHFNVFKILGIGHYEVRTHSPILGDLLNPKGSHHQGEIFLRLFLTQMQLSEFDAASARVKLEHYIGPVTEQSGGRIDIVIEDGMGHFIFIENKIFAADQNNQLRRYREYNKNSIIFYLTLKGEKPGGFDDSKIDETKVVCISYKDPLLSKINGTWTRGFDFIGLRRPQKGIWEDLPPVFSL